MRVLLVSLLVFSNACSGPPDIDEPLVAEVRLVSEAEGGLVESNVLSLIAAPDQSVKKRFGIVNIGMNTLVVESLNAPESLVQTGPTRLPGMVFELTSVEGVELEAGDTIMVPVTFHAGPVGNSTQSALLDLRFRLGLKRSQSVPFTLVGRTYRTDCAIITQGADLDLGRVAVGETVEERVVIRNDTSEVRSLIISPVGDTSSAITLGSTNELVLQPNTSQALGVRFAPTEGREERVSFLLKSPDGCADQLLRIRGESVQDGLTIDPASVDLGTVEPSSTLERSITFRNHTSRPITLSGIALQSLVMPPEFTLLTPGPYVVPEGSKATGTWRDGTFTVTVRFVSRVPGTKTASLFGRTSLVTKPSFAVALRAATGTRRLTFSSPLEFGELAFFAGSVSTTTRTVQLRSTGTLPLQFSRPAFSVTPVNTATLESELCVGTFDAATNQCLGLVTDLTIAPGGVFALPLHVVPANANGPKEWDITFHSDDTRGLTATLRVTARPVALPPCQFSVTPPAIDFGSLELGEPGVRAPVRVCNLAPPTATADRCLLHSFSMSGVGFASQQLPQSVVELGPQQCLAFDVRATGTAPDGAHLGQLEFSVSSPSRPRVTIPLTMDVGSKCLTIAPVDFGLVAASCSAAPQVVRILNRCTTPVAVARRATSGSIQPGVGSCPAAGPACSTFGVQGPLGVPCAQGRCLPPGLTTEQLTLSLTRQSDSLEGLYQLETLEPQPRSYLVPLRATETPLTLATETFTPPPPQADVLIVVDDTDPYQLAFSQNVTSFLSWATAHRIDWQAGVTIAEDDLQPDGTCGGGTCTTGHLLPQPGSQARVVNGFQPDAGQLLGATVLSVGHNGSPVEKCLQPALAAVSWNLRGGVNAGFVREEASFGVLCMTKSSEQSWLPMAHASVLVDASVGGVRSGRFSWSIITPVFPAPSGCFADQGPNTPSHSDVVSAFNGLFVDACSIDWPTALTTIGAQAFGQRQTFFLRGTPLSSSGMTVKQAGIPLPATVWRYDAASNAVVVTEPAYLPVAGAGLDISYPLTCL